MVVELNKANFEYDVNALVKAFYPEERVYVLTPETGEKKRKEQGDAPDVTIALSDGGACVIVGGREFWWRYSGENAENGPDMPDVPPGVPTWTENAAACGNLSYKDSFKRFLYRVLAEVTGRQLPWGNLTGIRPTKIAYGMLGEGRSREEIVGYYRDRYYVSEKKAELSVDIAEWERKILSGVHYEDGYSLYIGIPFCPTTCLYCSFTSYPIAAYRKMTDAYIDCLIREMEFTAECFRGKILDCVYIGGGTPTTLSPEQLDRLICCLKRLFDFSTVQEFTVEAGRADSITEEKLKVLHRHGVSRISVNPQTMKQETLNLIGRRATVEQVEEAYGLARSVGFDNINMDLILGLPGETEEDVQRTIDRVAELGPDSLTVHSLAIKRASKLNLWIQEHGVSLLRNTDETMRIAAEGAERLGMKPYYLYRQKNMSGNLENVGYAKPDKPGLYNILIMEEMQTIAALGAGSISKRICPDGLIVRSENVKEAALYLEKIDEMIERKRELFTGKY